AWGALYSRASVRQPAAPETCPLSLHDALPIFAGVHRRVVKIELCHASLCRSIRPWKSPATSKTTEKTQRMQHLRVPVAEPTRCAVLPRACLISPDIDNGGNKNTGSAIMNHPMKIL